VALTVSGLDVPSTPLSQRVCQSLFITVMQTARKLLHHVKRARKGVVIVYLHVFFINKWNFGIRLGYT